MRSALRWLPRGQTLPDEAWRSRHRVVVGLLLAHAAGFAVGGIALGHSLTDTVAEASIPALGALAASRPALPRMLRSSIGAFSTMLCSIVLVHFMGGSIEAHFHFFAMIPVVALYEDWLPFGLASVVVLVHHGLMGTTNPEAVYNHPGAWSHPWRWALVHTAFFGSACIGALANWRLHERARDAEQALSVRLRHQAHHDPLTGLPNRTRLVEVADELLARANRTGRPLAVLLIDLDRFKEINDVLGHAAGDRLLTRVAEQMSHAMRGRDLLARLGGDEFAALLPDSDETAAGQVARRLIAAVNETTHIDGIDFNVDASVGITMSTGPDDDVDALLRRADVAMYSAKRDRTGSAVYALEHETATRERLVLVSELRQAVARGELVVHYQPKVELTGARAVGAEALARWQHPAHGLLGPESFIDTAESTGVIVALTLDVLETSLRDVRGWQRRDPTLTMAVNLSPRCLADPTLPSRVEALLRQYDVPAALLELEITENTLAHDPERARQTLGSLHAMGVRLSIDDFGTGYSSMSYLRQLPVSELKVDRSFVAEMVERPDVGAMVRSVVDLGHSLGLTVVAEGVEDAATWQALVAAGCDVAQGFHISKPLPAADMERWLRRRARALPAPRRPSRGAAPARGAGSR